MIFNYCPFCQSPLQHKINKLKCFPCDFSLNFRFIDCGLHTIGVKYNRDNRFYEIWVFEWGSKIWIDYQPNCEVVHLTMTDWDWSSLDAFEAQVQAILAFS